MKSTIFVVVSGRSEILESRKYDAPDSKEFPFKLKLTKKMAPSSQLLVYYFHPDGEIIYDQVKLDRSSSTHKVRLADELDNVNQI